MGIAEKRVRTRARRETLKSAILGTVAAAGLISLSVVAPNIPKIIPRDLLEKIFNRSRNARDSAVSKLVREGLLARERQGKARLLRITGAGRRYLDLLRKQYSVATPKRWGHKWRMVIFDIREPRRATRDALRRELRAVGFQKVQDSVWVYPYPCEDFIALLKSDLHVGRDILYVVAEELEYDHALRKTFDLSQT